MAEVTEMQSIHPSGSIDEKGIHTAGATQQKGMDTTGSIEEKGIHRTDTAGSSYEIDKAVERSYLWKLDTRLIPLLSFMYLLW